MKQFEEIRKRKAEIEEIGRRHGISHIRVFGSVARGEETPESDIDMLVSVEDERSYFDIIRFQREIGEIFGKTVEAIPEGGVHHLLRDVIFTEAKPI